MYNSTKASLQNSRYSAGQFIKLTAQIDLLREELRRERQQRCVLCLGVHVFLPVSIIHA